MHLEEKPVVMCAEGNKVDMFGTAGWCEASVVVTIRLVLYTGNGVVRVVWWQWCGGSGVVRLSGGS